MWEVMVTSHITANNAGPGTAAGVSVSDVLPAGYTYKQVTHSTVGTFVFSLVCGQLIVKQRFKKRH
jgi:uncharacterized repeat protein (TIGR01451 family)